MVRSGCLALGLVWALGVGGDGEWDRTPSPLMRIKDCFSGILEAETRHHLSTGGPSLSITTQTRRSRIPVESLPADRRTWVQICTASLLQWGAVLAPSIISHESRGWGDISSHSGCFLTSSLSFSPSWTHGSFILHPILLNTSPRPWGLEVSRLPVKRSGLCWGNSVSPFCECQVCLQPPKEQAGLWMSLADGHRAACVMIMLPSLSPSENQDMRRPSLQWDLLAPWSVSGEAGQWHGRAGNCGSPVVNASLHQPLPNARVWFGRLTWIVYFAGRSQLQSSEPGLQREWKGLQPQCLDSNLQGAFSQYTCPFIVTHGGTISRRTHRSFFKATIVVWAWY